MNVSLRAIDESNRKECVDLQVTPSQTNLIAPNSNSLAWAEANPSCVPLGIFIEESMVGFAMYEARGSTVFSVHRFMVDASHQRKGIGYSAMNLLMDKMFDLGAKTIYLSFKPDNLGAKALYEKLGFVFHIKEPDGEVIYRFGPTGDLGT